ncbi:MAG: nucleotide exchange factor GrpE [Candidatus Melainabacteria bacterium]
MTQTQPKTESDSEQETETASADLSADSPAASEESAESPAAVSAEDYQSLQDQFIRLQADFDNFRKRVNQEREHLLKYGAQSTMVQLLPVLDNLQRGTASLTEQSDPKILYQSFRLVYNELMNGLTQLGLKPIAAVGQPFDPQFHEAVGRAPSSEIPEEHVVAEAQPGYQLHDVVLRPSLVQVSDGPAADADNPFKEASATGTPHVDVDG